MLFRILLVLICLGVAAVAKPLQLKCTAADGRSAGELIVDLDAKTMTWGVIQSYAITGVTDRYITGVFNGFDHIGGEIFVLDRTTGNYQRALVAMTCEEKKCPETKLTAFTYFGRCLRPML